MLNQLVQPKLFQFISQTQNTRRNLPSLLNPSDVILNEGSEMENTMMEIEEIFEERKEEEKEDHFSEILPRQLRFIERTENSIEEEAAMLIHQQEADNHAMKEDGRKGRSGRKPKTSEALLKEIMSNLAYKRWVQIEEKSSKEGFIEKIIYCEWCRKFDKDVQLNKGLLFSTNDTIAPSFHLTRLSEHAQVIKKHKEAKSLMFSQVLNFSPLLQEPSNLVSFYEMYSLMEFLLLMIEKNLSLNTMEDIVALIKNKGFPLPEHYMVYNSLKEIILTMAEEMKNIIVERVSNSPYFL